MDSRPPRRFRARFKVSSARLALSCALLFAGGARAQDAAPFEPMQQQEDTAGYVQSLVTQADGFIVQNRYAEAVASLNEAYTLAGDPRESHLARNVLNSLANLHYNSGQLALAERYFEELAALDAETGDQAALSVSLFNLGHAAASSRRFDEAAMHFERALGISLATGDDSGAAYTYKAMGVNAQAQNDLRDALDYLSKARELFGKLNDEAQTASVLRNLADVEQELGSTELALEHYLEALPVLAEYEMNSALLRTYRGMSLAYEQLQQLDRALIAQRAYTDLLQQELEQQSSETTQRLQAELDTRRYADNNARLEAISARQQQKLEESQQVQRLQFMVLLLTVGILLLVLFMHRRSRNMQKRLHTLANTDELTKLLNRRAVMQSGMLEWQRTLREEQPFSCLVLDVDHFKSINDTFGHATGDDVLRKLAEILQTTFRQSDAIGRIGGEEFLVFTSSTDANQAHLLAERIRARVENAEVPGIGKRKLTISIGIGCRQRETSLEQLIQHADQALYQAKQTGRNRTVLYRPELRPQLSLVSGKVPEPDAGLMSPVV